MIDIYINDITKDINIDTNTIFDVTIIALDKAFINSFNKYIFTNSFTWIIIYQGEIIQTL